MRISLSLQNFLLALLAAGIPLLSLLALQASRIEEEKISIVTQWTFQDLEQFSSPEYLFLAQDFTPLERKAVHYLSLCILDESGAPKRCFGADRPVHFQPGKRGVVHQAPGELHIQIPVHSSSFNRDVAGYIHAVVSTETADRLVKGFTKLLALSAGLVLAMLLPVIFVASHISGKTMRRIANSMRDTRKRLKAGGRIDEGDLIPISSVTTEIQDITDSYNDLVTTLARLQYQYEMLLQAYKLRSEEEMEEVKRASAMLAHEMKVPVSLIQGAVKGLWGDLKTLEDVLGDTSIFDEKISLILDKLDILDSNVRQILAMYRDGAVTIHPAYMDVRGWAESVAEIARNIAETCGNRFRCKVAGKTRFFHTDQHRLTQALLAILDNAARYTRDGMITLEIHCAGSELRIEVADTGAGIPKEILSRIFDPFLRSHGVDGRSGKGLGVGLYIAKSCIEALGGVIEVKSVVGLGTRFKIVVPPVPGNGASSPRQDFKTTEPARGRA